ncbi:DUF2182 domain-containing protein [Tropicibacter sp. Alg240-R139]|uniref:DUF2182 domain-containing protein n=1 Tax=Tropicibacter sp. Alg240-R139 TaxID=2305991 RepID=UPI0013E0B6C7|nr:DUF2182 domain-containing protein [Tropicibacter sp. Alg240-R139]
MTRKTGVVASERIEQLVRRDKAIVLISLSLVICLSAAYTVVGVGMNMSAAEMTRMARPIGEPMTMGPNAPWTVLHALVIFLMWWVMMIAMMTPSAAPTVLLFAAIKKMGPDGPRAGAFTGLFLAGYLVTWGIFSLGATGAQWGLEAAGLSDGPMMTLKSKGAAGALLLAAGLYQFTAFKDACLRHCRSPAHFLAEHRRPGLSGAFVTGADHGLYCLGCCWALMALLFVGGVMNLYWIAGIAIYVGLEKITPHGRWLSYATGAALVCCGLYLIGTATFSTL